MNAITSLSNTTLTFQSAATVARLTTAQHLEDNGRYSNDVGGGPDEPTGVPTRGDYHYIDAPRSALRAMVDCGVPTRGDFDYIGAVLKTAFGVAFGAAGGGIAGAVVGAYYGAHSGAAGGATGALVGGVLGAVVGGVIGGTITYHKVSK